MFWFLVLILATVIAIVIAMVIVYTIRRLLKSPATKPSSGKPVPTMIVLGSGGHTMEMTKLIQHLNWNHYKPVHIVLGSGDKMSLRKIPEELRGKCEVHIIKRSRNVGQSYLTSMITTALATLDAFRLVWRTRPALLICNGPGTCLPLCLCVKMITDCVILYVESFCRVHSLSLTGKLLYPFTDHFIVQWPQLQEKYSRSRYLGLLV